MIIDKIKNVPQYKFKSQNFASAFRFIENTDLNSLLPGKYVIEEDKVIAYVNEYKTKDKVAVSWETHKKFIDIQILIEGEEQIGYGWIDNLTIIKEYDPEKDIMFFNGTGEYLTLKKGLFAIFFPHDAHQPGLHSNKQMHVKKLVVKVIAE